MRSVLMIVVIVMLWCVCQKNSPPEIQSIVANPDSLGLGGTTTLFVEADDPDNDEITFTWRSAYGSFSDTIGQSVTWTAPGNQGTYTVTVIAVDEKGASDQDNIEIPVGGGGLVAPNVSYEVRNYGMLLHLYWVAIPDAGGYYIYADGSRVNSTSDNFYDASVPASYYAVSAYQGTVESPQDTIDCLAVVTSNITVYGWTDPDPYHPSGIGFDTSGIATALALSDSANRPYIDYYFDDGNYTELTIVSPDQYGYNGETNTAANSWLNDFNALTIADSSAGNYAVATTLYSNDVYSLWIDPNSNGWDNMVDHFGKMKVEAIYGSYPPFQALLTLAYQKITGLRWVVTQ